MWSAPAKMINGAKMCKIVPQIKGNGALFLFSYFETRDEYFKKFTTSIKTGKGKYFVLMCNKIPPEMCKKMRVKYFFLVARLPSYIVLFHCN